MKYKTSSYNGKFKIPSVKTYNLLSDQLLIFVRSWSSEDLSSKIIDEINHFLSSIDADLEVTTPFEYFEHQSSLMNKVRISLLLANDLVYKSENKDVYHAAAEVAMIYKKNKELVCASVGQFKFTVDVDGHEFCIHDSGMGFNNELPLPQNVLGLDRSVDVTVRSIRFDDSIKKVTVVSSYCNREAEWKADISV